MKNQLMLTVNAGGGLLRCTHELTNASCWSTLWRSHQGIC